MSELEWIRQGLADRRIAVAAERTGLSEPTLRGIRDGTNTNPTIGTLDKIRAYLMERAR